MNLHIGELSPLDPRRDPERWEALLRRTRAAAADELARRALLSSWPAAPLARWVRPALSLAAAMVVMAAGLLALSERTQPAAASTTAPGVAEAMGMPVAMTGVVDPSSRVDQLLLQEEGDSR